MDICKGKLLQEEFDKSTQISQSNKMDHIQPPDLVIVDANQVVLLAKITRSSIAFSTCDDCPGCCGVRRCFFFSHVGAGSVGAIPLVGRQTKRNLFGDQAKGVRGKWYLPTMWALQL